MRRATLTASDRHNTSALQPADHLTPGETPPAWVPLPAAAERLSLCDRTIRRAISRGELRGYKFGKAVRVRLDELDAWAEGKAIPIARTVKSR